VKANIPQVKYQYFDFHNECKHMRWDRINLLIDSLADDLLRDGCVFQEFLVNLVSHAVQLLSPRLEV
jgi:hypothetical protein